MGSSRYLAHGAFQVPASFPVKEEAVLIQHGVSSSWHSKKDLPAPSPAFDFQDIPSCTTISLGWKVRCSTQEQKTILISEYKANFQTSTRWWREREAEKCHNTKRGCNAGRTVLYGSRWGTPPEGSLSTELTQPGGHTLTDIFISRKKYV